MKYYNGLTPETLLRWKTGRNCICDDHQGRHNQTYTAREVGENWFGLDDVSAWFCDCYWEVVKLINSETALPFSE